jgi:hypothetical protein
MMYRSSEPIGMDYGVPVTEGPILGNGGAFPVHPGTIVTPGPVVAPGTPPSIQPPYMPPASGTQAPPLNAPPPTGPMPRLAPAPGVNPTKS